MSSHGNLEKKKILIVSQFYYPDVTAAAFRIKETADLLLEKGYSVHVIAGEPHKGKAGNDKINDKKIKVTRVPLIQYSGNGKWSYILHYLSFMFGAIYASWKHPSRFDIVWASSPPLFTGISGYVISVLKKATFALDIRDIWPDSAVVAGQISSTGILYKVAKLVEKYLYTKACLITCVAKPMARYIATVEPSKSPVVIYNAVPKSMLVRNKTIENLQDGHCSILYIGNMGVCQNLDLVLDAAKILDKKSEYRVKYILVGKGTETHKLKQRLESENIKNVEIRGLVSKSEALTLIKNCSALMLHLKDDGTMDKTIPSKVFDYMSGGRPILFGLKGEAYDILSSIKSNLYYNPADAQQLAEQSITLANNYEELNKLANQNRLKVEAEFTREKMVDKLIEAFAGLLKNERTQK